MKYFYNLLFLFNVYNLYCEPVDSITAKKIAINFIRHQYNKFYKDELNLKIEKINEFKYEDKTAFYIVSFKDSGFVIVSANTNAFPIFGYSYQNKIDLNNLPPAFISYVNKAAIQVTKYAEKNYSEINTKLWNDILNNNLKLNTNTKGIGPLVNLYWGQEYPYNMYCPPHHNGPGGHCVTGCVATAMAMIMKYHNYPERGKGFKVFVWSEPDTIDFENTYYEWSKMTPIANVTSASAIALLMFHCGVSVDMSYGPNGSASYTEFVPNALKTYFRYHPSVRYKTRSHYFDNEWDMLIRDELNYKRPVLYSGNGTGGHAFVCDGYQDTCFYHFNWGWNGYANGYYYYNDLTPGNNDFTYSQGAVVNIMPYYGNYCVQNFTYIDTARFIDDGSGLSYYWNNTNCSWLIKPMNNKRIELTFTKFDTELNKDILYIYDGPNSLAPLIGEFSGNYLPPIIYSSGNTLFLKFITDSLNQRPGWEAYYTTFFNQITKNSTEDKIEVLYNSNEKLITIKMSNIVDENTTIKLYNILGEIIYFSKPLTTFNKIETNNLKGIYIVNVTNSNLFISKKVIIY
ncbi:MAG: C10 family peptidase [Bacteroidales bacterium]|nr:C10 family peptidase [Bacteroidales bacterium]